MDNQVCRTSSSGFFRRVNSCAPWLLLFIADQVFAQANTFPVRIDWPLLLALAVVMVFLGYAIYLRWRLQVLQAERQLILHNAPCAVVVWDKHGCVLSWNRKAEEIFGWSSDEVIGKSFAEFLLPIEAFERRADFIQEHIGSGKRSVSEDWNLTKSGEKIYCRWMNQSMSSSISFSRAMCVSMAENITERYELQKSLQVRNVAFDAAPNPIVITDQHGVINYINPAFTQLLGYLNDDVVGKHASCVWDQSEIAIYADIQAALSQGRIWRGELLRNRKDGKQVVHAVAISPVFDLQGKVTQFVSMEMDVGSYKVLQQQLEYAAFFDDLTRLPNRAMFLDYLDRILANAQRNNQSFALFFIDLNGFKEINDTYGHDVGDKVLQILAVRLRDRLRASDIVARLGGDEFTMIATGISDRDAARQLAEKIISEMDYPIALDDGSCQLGASVGIAMYPADAIDRDELLNCADKAMYGVKRAADRHYLFYDQLNNNAH